MGDNYDLVIVGAGAAGLSAGIYAVRKGLKVLIISADLGGQASTTVTVENYPGIINQTGPDIMRNFLKQYISFGGVIKFEKVSSVQKEGKEFLVEAKNSYHSSAVLLAFGKTPTELAVDGIKQLSHDDISYAIEDIMNYYKLDVAIVGGGNSAVQYAIDLADASKSITVINKTSALKCEKVLEDKLTILGSKIKILNDSVMEKLSKNDKRATIHINSSGNPIEFNVDKIIVAIGYHNQTSWLGDIVETDKIGQIIVDAECRTKTEGLFAAGDVTNIPFKQMVIAAAEGAKAAISVTKYLNALKGIRTPTIDWGIIKK